MLPSLTAVFTKVGRSIDELALGLAVIKVEVTLDVDWKTGTGRTLALEDWRMWRLTKRLQCIVGLEELLTVVVDDALDAVVVDVGVETEEEV